MLSKKMISIFLLVIILSASVIIFADVKVVKSGRRKVNTVESVDKVDIPKDYKKIVVNGDVYYVKNGVYYRHNKKSLKISKAPKGAKIKHLPDGVKFIKRRGKNYYYFYHTWYVYDQKADIYIVIDKPEYIEDNYDNDKLYMVNGSVLIGTYMGGTNEDVRFFFNDEIKRIPIEDIISIEFGAAIE